MSALFSEADWRRKSWVDAANEAACGFPLQSLPYCVFESEGERARPGVGIGGWILDLKACAGGGLLDGLPAGVGAACEGETLNGLMALGGVAQGALRARLTEMLAAEASEAIRKAAGAKLVAMAGARLMKPVAVGNYTDFYASKEHATRVGRLFRPENPLLPNYVHLPIGYHGRASSIVVSGTPVRRPLGQTRPVEADGMPEFGPTRFLDYEVELGLYVGEGNALGEAVPVREAMGRIFGVSLVNDWSARDMQAWEYQPLGPFLGKSFATSVGAWVVPMAALGPFRWAARLRADGQGPLEYLFDAMDQYTGALDVTVEAWLRTAAMREAGMEAHRLSRATAVKLWWTPAQLVAHHTSNGCNLQPGDLLATGTVSNEEEESAGCLLELTEGGKRALVMPNGERRTALEDGDEVILRGYCRRTGFPDVQLGECRGVVAGAI